MCSCIHVHVWSSLCMARIMYWVHVVAVWLYARRTAPCQSHAWWTLGLRGSWTSGWRLVSLSVCVSHLAFKSRVLSCFVCSREIYREKTAFITGPPVAKNPGVCSSSILPSVLEQASQHLLHCSKSSSSHTSSTMRKHQAAPSVPRWPVHRGWFQHECHINSHIYDVIEWVW